MGLLHRLGEMRAGARWEDEVVLHAGEVAREILSAGLGEHLRGKARMNDERKKNEK